MRRPGTGAGAQRPRAKVTVATTPGDGRRSHPPPRHRYPSDTALTIAPIEWLRAAKQACHET